MNKSQFEAGTFGVGELITQRKLFRVPPHQRSYAWDKDAVNDFLSDIGAAFERNAPEYFIGQVVIQGPDEGEWTLLDGQQRLTTSTMLFASIRTWLNEHGMPDDARQVETEYLGVRRLGGDYSSRMQLNHENQRMFKESVFNQISMDKLKALQQTVAKKTSNRYLVDAALDCQIWVNSMAAQSSKSVQERAERLFRLASFIESRVKVVCVEISNEADPYILFESLNDRGVALSALDLLKNYAFSKNPPGASIEFDQLWTRLLTQLDDRNPDDFLKVSWTAANGVVQKTQLFKSIRTRYRTKGELLGLLENLIKDARILAALEEPEDPFWSDYSPRVRDYIYALHVLGGRQARPVVLAAISSLTPESLEDLLWRLIVVIVRFQIIGRGRTGVVEKVFGKLCTEITTGNLKHRIQFEDALRELWLTNELFTAAFATHTDSKLSRFTYFLAEIELYLQPDLVSIQNILARCTLTQLATDKNFDRDECTIGGFALIKPNFLRISQGISEKPSFEDSVFVSTVKAKDSFQKNSNFDDAINARSLEFAELAPQVWAFNR